MDGVLDALWPAFFLAHGYVNVALGMGVFILCYFGFIAGICEKCSRMDFCRKHCIRLSFQ